MSDKFSSLMEIEPGQAEPGVAESLLAEEVNGDGQEKGQEGGVQVEPAPESEAAGGEASSEEAKPGEQTTEAKPETPPVATFKAKHGDTELEVPEEAAFTVKVNSKDEVVPLKDLIRNYQGKVPWEQHYRTLKESERRFQADKKLVDEKITDLVSTLEKDPRGALEKLILWSGKNPADFAALYAEELEKLDENGQKQFLTAKRLEHENKTIAATAAELKRQNDDRQLEGYISGKQKQLGISDEELARAFNTLDSLIKEGQFDPKGKTGEQIADIVFNFITTTERPYQHMVGLVKKNVPGVTPDAKDIKFLLKLIEPDMAENDVIDIVKSFYNIDDKNGDSSVEAPASSEASSKERPTKATSPKIPQKEKAKPKAEVGEDDDDPKTFDDLIRPYSR